MIKKYIALFICTFFFVQGTVLAGFPEANFWSQRQNKLNQAKQSQEKASALLQNFGESRSRNPEILMASLPKAHPGLSASLSPRVLSTLGIQGHLDSKEMESKLSSTIPGWIQTSIAPYGTIQDIHVSKDPKAKTVLLIQDAHLHFEAQTNIAGAIDALARAKMARAKEDPSSLLIGMEGSDAETADFSEYNKYPHRAILREVAEAMLKANILNGIEYAAIGYQGQDGKGPVELPFEVIGLENINEYNANVEAIQAAVPLKDKAKKALSQIKRSLVDAKSKHYTPALIELDAKTAAFEEGTLGLPEYVLYLDALSPAKTAQLKDLIEASLLEGAIDFDKVERERTQILEILMGKMSEKDIEALINLSSLYQTGHVSYSGYYDYLKNLSKRHGIKFVDYPEMTLYIQYVLKSEKIDGNLIFAELRGLEEAVQAKLIHSKKQRRLAEDTKDYHLLTKLADHILTEEEWHLYQDRKSQSAKNEDEADEDFDPYQEEAFASTKDLWPVFEDFYHAAIARNHIMVSRLSKKLKESPTKTAVLVAGGFHTQGLVNLLKKEGLTILTISPHITTFEEGLSSVDILASGRLPLDQLFVGERLFIPLPSKGPILPLAAATISQAKVLHMPGPNDRATHTVKSKNPNEPDHRYESEENPKEPRGLTLSYPKRNRTKVSSWPENRGMSSPYRPGRDPSFSPQKSNAAFSLVQLLPIIVISVLATWGLAEIVLLALDPSINIAIASLWSDLTTPFTVFETASANITNESVKSSLLMLMVGLPFPFGKWGAKTSGSQENNAYRENLRSVQTELALLQRGISGEDRKSAGRFWAALRGLPEWPEQGEPINEVAFIAELEKVKEILVNKYGLEVLTAAIKKNPPTSVPILGELFGIQSPPAPKASGKTKLQTEQISGLQPDDVLSESDKRIQKQPYELGIDMHTYVPTARQMYIRKLRFELVALRRRMFPKNPDMAAKVEQINENLLGMKKLNQGGNTHQPPDTEALEALKLVLIGDIDVELLTTTIKEYPPDELPILKGLFGIQSPPAPKSMKAKRKSADKKLPHEKGIAVPLLLLTGVMILIAGWGLLEIILLVINLAPYAPSLWSGLTTAFALWEPASVIPTTQIIFAASIAMVGLAAFYDLPTKNHVGLLALYGELVALRVGLAHRQPVSFEMLSAVDAMIAQVKTNMDRERIVPDLLYTKLLTGVKEGIRTKIGEDSLAAAIVYAPENNLPILTEMMRGKEKGFTKEIIASLLLTASLFGSLFGLSAAKENGTTDLALFGGLENLLPLLIQYWQPLVLIVIALVILKRRGNFNKPPKASAGKSEETTSQEDLQSEPEGESTTATSQTEAAVTGQVPAPGGGSSGPDGAAGVYLSILSSLRKGGNLSNQIRAHRKNEGNSSTSLPELRKRKVTRDEALIWFRALAALRPRRSEIALMIFNSLIPESSERRDKIEFADLQSRARVALGFNSEQQVQLADIFALFDDSENLTPEGLEEQKDIVTIAILANRTNPDANILANYSNHLENVAEDELSDELRAVKNIIEDGRFELSSKKPLKDQPTIKDVLETSARQVLLRDTVRSAAVELEVKIGELSDDANSASESAADLAKAAVLEVAVQLHKEIPPGEVEAHTLSRNSLAINLGRLTRFLNRAAEILAGNNATPEAIQNHLGDLIQPREEALDEDQSAKSVINWIGKSGFDRRRSRFVESLLAAAAHSLIQFPAEVPIAETVAPLSTQTEEDADSLLQRQEFVIQAQGGEEDLSSLNNIAIAGADSDDPISLILPQSIDVSHTVVAEGMTREESREPINEEAMEVPLLDESTLDVEAQSDNEGSEESPVTEEAPEFVEEEQPDNQVLVTAGPSESFLDFPVALQFLQAIFPIGAFLWLTLAFNSQARKRVLNSLLAIQAGPLGSSGLRAGEASQEGLTGNPLLSILTFVPGVNWLVAKYTISRGLREPEGPQILFDAAGASRDPGLSDKQLQLLAHAKVAASKLFPDINVKYIVRGTGRLPKAGEFGFGRLVIDEFGQKTVEIYVTKQQLISEAKVLQAAAARKQNLSVTDEAAFLTVLRQITHHEVLHTLGFSQQQLLAARIGSASQVLEVLEQIGEVEDTLSFATSPEEADALASDFFAEQGRKKSVTRKTGDLHHLNPNPTSEPRASRYASFVIRIINSRRLRILRRRHPRKTILTLANVPFPGGKRSLSSSELAEASETLATSPDLETRALRGFADLVADGRPITVAESSADQSLREALAVGDAPLMAMVNQLGLKYKFGQLFRHYADEANRTDSRIQVGILARESSFMELLNKAADDLKEDALAVRDAIENGRLDLIFFNNYLENVEEIESALTLSVDPLDISPAFENIWGQIDNENITNVVIISPFALTVSLSRFYSQLIITLAQVVGIEEGEGVQGAVEAWVITQLQL